MQIQQAKLQIGQIKRELEEQKEKWTSEKQTGEEKLEALIDEDMEVDRVMQAQAEK